MLGGGNTFYILDRLRKTGLDKFLRKFVKSGGYNSELVQEA
jgi:peptidase E